MGGGAQATVGLGKKVRPLEWYLGMSRDELAGLLPWGAGLSCVVGARLRGHLGPAGSKEHFQRSPRGKSTANLKTLGQFGQKGPNATLWAACFSFQGQCRICMGGVPAPLEPARFRLMALWRSAIPDMGTGLGEPTVPLESPPAGCAGEPRRSQCVLYQLQAPTQHHTEHNQT